MVPIACEVKLQVDGKPDIAEYFVNGLGLLHSGLEKLRSHELLVILHQLGNFLYFPSFSHLAKLWTILRPSPLVAMISA